MWSKALSKGGWDNQYTIVKNGEAVELYGGTAVSYDLAVADGSVLLPITANFQLMAGFIDTGVTLAASGGDKDYGAAMVRGYHAGIYMFGSTITPGALLKPVTGKSYVSQATTFAHAASTAEEVAYDEGIVCAVAGGTVLIAGSTFGDKTAAWVRCLKF
jgi:hypothetical protein